MKTNAWIDFSTHFICLQSDSVAVHEGKTTSNKKSTTAEMLCC